MVIWVAALLHSPLVGGDVVIFTNGGWLEVTQCTVKGSRATLVLKSGGVVECPMELIKELRRSDPSSQQDNESTDEGLFSHIVATSHKYQVDARLVNSICEVESNFNPRAVSPKGAMGLMQLMPQTAIMLGVHDPFDSQLNLEAGVKYLRHLLQTFNGDVELALAAYNAGEQVVQRLGRVPPYPETVNYIKKVMESYFREP